jgi:hypothetical protein
VLGERRSRRKWKRLIRIREILRNDGILEYGLGGRNDFIFSAISAFSAVNIL